MKETRFPSRIPPEMASGFLSRELQVHVMAPAVIAQLIALLSIEDRQALCRSIIKFRRDLSGLIESTVKLQLSTCAAFAITDLQAADGLDKARALNNLIDKLALQSADDTERFEANVTSTIGDAKADFQSCMASAAINFQKLRK